MCVPLILCAAVMNVLDPWRCRPSESLQEIANAPPPLATVMKDKAKMDTEVKLESKLPSIEVRPTTLATTMNLTYDLDLRSPSSYGRYLLMCKSSRSAVSWFKR